MWIKASTSRKSIVKLIDALQLAFERLRALQAEAEVCRQGLQRIDARDKWLLVFDAEYNRIQSEWDKAFTKFHRLATEASDLIIEENDRRFGEWRHRPRTAFSKQFPRRDGASISWSANGKPRHPAPPAGQLQP